MLYRTFTCDVKLAVLGGLVCLSGCAVIDTGATVVKAGASVVGTSVSVASTVASTTADVALKTVATGVTVASAGVAAASAAKSVTIAAAGTAVAAGSMVAAALATTAASRRVDDIASAPVVAASADHFIAQDGRQWRTRNCAETPAGAPALWVALRSGETEIRVSTGTVCPVLAAE